MVFHRLELQKQPEDAIQTKTSDCSLRFLKSESDRSKYRPLGEPIHYIIAI